MQFSANSDCALHGNPPAQTFVLGGSSAHFLGNLCGVSAIADGILVAELYSWENLEPLNSQWSSSGLCIVNIGSRWFVKSAGLYLKKKELLSILSLEIVFHKHNSICKAVLLLVSNNGAWPLCLQLHNLFWKSSRARCYNPMPIIDQKAVLFP